MLQALPTLTFGGQSVIKCSDDAFCLMGLEMVVQLGCKWDTRKHGSHLNARSENSLTRGKYTAESNLALMEQLMTEPGLLRLGDFGSQFDEQLMYMQ